MKEKTVMFLLGIIARFPLGVLYLIADLIYLVVYYLIGYRRKVVYQNLKSAFPSKQENDIKKIEKEFYHFLCDVIVETVKLLHISPKEMSRRVIVENAELVNESCRGGKSAVLLLAHYGNWEWVQEISRYVTDKAFKTSIYHPLNHQPWDHIFSRIRSHWDVRLLTQAQAARTLLDRNHQPWVCGFIADQRPRHKDHDNWVDFLNIPTSFIYGPELIGAKVNADFFYLEMRRKKRGYYQITFHKLIPQKDSMPYPHTREFWKEFQNVVEKNPAFWLWSHKRWK